MNKLECFLMGIALSPILLFCLLLLFSLVSYCYEWLVTKIFDRK